MSHILFVEDETAVQEFVLDTLKGYQVGIARNVADALAYLKANHVDLLLLDLQLGTDNGMTIARYIREQSPHVAIVILTGQGSLKSAIQAIELDAQAYLLKPVNPDKLEGVIAEQLAAMNARREQSLLAQHMRAAVAAMQLSNNDRVLATGHLHLDANRLEARCDDTNLGFSPGQFRILWMLVEAEPHAVSALELAQQALGYEIERGEAGDLVKGYIFQIRRKLNRCGLERDYIQTVRGEGYRWVGHSLGSEK